MEPEKVVNQLPEFLVSDSGWDLHGFECIVPVE